jgi:hypothetical protein
VTVVRREADVNFIDDRARGLDLQIDFGGPGIRAVRRK